MKKLLLLFCLGSLFLTAQNTAPRFGTAKNQNQTLAPMTAKYVTPTFTASYTSVANAYETVVNMGTLTGAQTVIATVSNCYAADKLTFIFTADTLTAGRVVTFTTGFKVSGTFTIAASKQGAIHFIFDGVSWVACGREKQ